MNSSSTPGATTPSAETDAVTGAELLDESNCWALLRSVDLGRLAMSAAGEVDIFPVNYVVDDASLVFRSAEGTKLVEVILTNGCAFEIDGYDAATQQAWSVVVKGDCELLDQQADVDAARALPLTPWNAGPKERFVRITPRAVSGRRFVVAPAASPRTH